jgi:hypothetical protein
MFGKRGCAVVVLLLALGIGCERGRPEPASTPPFSAVEVPAVPAETERAPRENRRAERPAPPDEPAAEERVLLDVVNDAGVRFTVTSAGRVQLWGNLKALDGGFVFHAGFSTGSASGPDAASDSP